MAVEMLFHVSHGRDDPERATIPFIAANVAQASGQQAAIVCTIDAVWLGTIGGTEAIQAPEAPALEELYTSFTEAGGEVWLCSACTRPRGIEEDHVRSGAAIVGAARIVEAIAEGAASITLA